MWLMTPIGFFSIVQKPADRQAGTLTVRARVLDDLAALKDQFLPALGPIREGAGTDYRYRATAPTTDVSSAFARMLGAIDYSNFKNEVAKVQGPPRAYLYNEVWGVLSSLQPNDSEGDEAT